MILWKQNQEATILYHHLVSPNYEITLQEDIVLPLWIECVGKSICKMFHFNLLISYMAFSIVRGDM